MNRGARWISGRASDSESRCPGFDPTGDTVLCPCARHINSPECWLKPTKRWLRPDMNWDVKLQYKQIQTIMHIN